MINRKKLARTSSEPGKTRQINFFIILMITFILLICLAMDIVKCLKRSKKKVGSFIEEYLVKSSKIALIIFLIDIRHNPTENDLHMYNYIISSKKPCLILANKADKIPLLLKLMDVVKKLHKLINPLGDITILPFSSERKIYR